MYTNKNDIAERVSAMATLEATAALPSGDHTFLCIRFPEIFAWDGPYYDILHVIKSELTETLWGVRDQIVEQKHVAIERVNPIADHDDTSLAGYYYLWLITPSGKMPEAFIPKPFEEYEDEAN